MEILSVPGVIDSLDEIAKYVIAASAEAEIEKKAAYNLRLAVDEIATNIILHGYQEAGYEGTVEIGAIITPESLTIFLEDTGIPYDPTKKLLPKEDDLNKPLAERPIGGLGVYLAVKGVDKFSYEWENGRNRNIFMVKRKNEA